MLPHRTLFSIECGGVATREWYRGNYGTNFKIRRNFIRNFFSQILLEAYSRCVSIMSADSNPSHVHYQIISNITKCFEVACNFENCKSKIIELPQLISDVCRVVYFKVSKIISSTARSAFHYFPFRLQHSLSVSLVTSLAANNYELQCNLVKCGVLWSLLLFMFEYDYTLDESGVVTDENTNQQLSLLHRVGYGSQKYFFLPCP